MFFFWTSEGVFALVLMAFIHSCYLQQQNFLEDVDTNASRSISVQNQMK
jgi:heme exporter protein D